MKETNEKELLTRFKDLEKKLIELLKINPIELNDEDSKATIKKHIKEYIKKVEDAKKTLAEYEKVADELNALNHEISKEDEAISKAMVKLRKEPKVKEEDVKAIASTEKYADELVVLDGKVVGTKKKKKAGSDSKEL